MSKTDTEVKRIGRFGAVGILNTLIDLSVFNTVRSLTMASRVQSGIISATFAMTFSFIANKKAVFKADRGSIVKQALVFVAVTAFGLYGLRSGAIHILTNTWTLPIDTGLAVAHWLGLSNFISDAKLVDNGALAAGTMVSMVWNYLMYKKVVFRNG